MRCREGERGSVMVLTGVASVLLVTLGVMLADLWQTALFSRHMQYVADLAAMAGARQLAGYPEVTVLQVVRAIRQSVASNPSDRVTHSIAGWAQNQYVFSEDHDHLTIGEYRYDEKAEEGYVQGIMVRDIPKEKRQEFIGKVWEEKMGDGSRKKWNGVSIYLYGARNQGLLRFFKFSETQNHFWVTATAHVCGNDQIMLGGECPPSPVYECLNLPAGYQPCEGTGRDLTQNRNYDLKSSCSNPQPEDTCEAVLETTLSTCGNGIIDTGESCDEGAHNGTLMPVNGTFQLCSRECQKFIATPMKHCDIGGLWDWRSHPCPEGTVYVGPPYTRLGCPAGTKTWVWPKPKTKRPPQFEGCYVKPLKGGTGYGGWCPDLISARGVPQADDCCFKMCRVLTDEEKSGDCYGSLSKRGATGIVKGAIFSEARRAAKKKLSYICPEIDTILRRDENKKLLSCNPEPYTNHKGIGFGGYTCGDS